MAKEKKNNIEDYATSNDSLVDLNHRDSVRSKIGMYAGGSSKEALFVLMREPIDNSIDEFNFLRRNTKNNPFKTLKIELNSKTNEVAIRDYGRGIPYVKNSNGLSSLERALTVVHSGGKHSNNDNWLLQEQIDTSNMGQYSFSSGINGVGACLVSYASDKTKAVVYNKARNEKAYIELENGYIVKEANIIPMKDPLPFELNECSTSLQEDTATGTLIIFKPSIKKDDFDEEGVFEPNAYFIKEQILRQLKILPYINPGLRIEFKYDDELIIFEEQENFKNVLEANNNKHSLIFKHNLELQSFQEEMIYARLKTNNTTKIFSFKDFISLDFKERNKYQIKMSVFEYSFNFINKRETPFQLYTANSSILLSGGKQEPTIKKIIKDTINEYVEKSDIISIKKMGTFENEDIMPSFTFLCMIKINKPDLAGQTKNDLINPEITQFANYFFKKYFKLWIERSDIKEIETMLKILDANKRARASSNKIMDNVFKDLNNNKSLAFLLENTTKLTKCKSKDSSLTELLLVEGDSAKGPVKDSRVQEYQAVLPLKGKLINALKTKDISRIISNDEIINLITALGCGIGKDYNYSKLNYNKILILSDSDIDGCHIKNLNLIFFYRFFLDLIVKGHLYIIEAPLYAITSKNKIEYAWNIEERNKITSSYPSNLKYEITRYKGLGEMNPNQMYDTCLNKQNRRITQIKLEHLNTNRIEEILTNIDNEKNIENLDFTYEELISIYMNDRPEDEDQRALLIQEYYKDNKTLIVNLDVDLE
jgi:DNA gyrase subunit B